MSIEICAIRFEHGEPAVLGDAAVQDAFAGLIAHSTPQGHQLDLGLPVARLMLRLSRTAAGVHGFSLGRPVDDERLYTALVQLLQIEGVTVYAPGSPPVVGHPDSEVHLPPGLVAALGPAVQARSAAALHAALFAP